MRLATRAGIPFLPVPKNVRHIRPQQKHIARPKIPQLMRNGKHALTLDDQGQLHLRMTMECIIKMRLPVHLYPKRFIRYFRYGEI